MNKMLYYSLPKAQDQVCITFTNNINATTGVQDTAATITVDNQSSNKVRLGSVECWGVHKWSCSQSCSDVLLRLLSYCRWFAYARYGLC